MRLSLDRLAIHPVLLGAYFVLFLYAENLLLVRPVEVVEPLAWAIGGSTLLLLVASAVLRSWTRGALVASALVVSYMAYGHVAEVIGDAVPVPAMILAWLLLLGFAVVLALYPRTPVGTLTGGLNLIAVVLLAFALSSIIPYNLQSAARADDTHLQPSGLTATRTTERDIYYLVYDRYGSASSLAAEFDITDNDLYDWLAQRGFDVVPRGHANYSRTTLSMASVLNLDYLHDVAAHMGPHSRDQGPIHGMLQDHVVGRFLREQGYRYIHVGSWFNPTRHARLADEVLEFETATEFEAVLYETTAMPLLQEHLGGEEPVMPPADRSHVDNALFQFRALDRLLSDPGPKFVLAHVLLPHDPYVFDEDGAYISPAERADDPEAVQFGRQLEFTNRHIKGYLERLLDRPADQQPIIVLVADEGPFPARYRADWDNFDWADATPEELEAKFGILQAYYLPPQPDQPANVPEPYPTMTAVNAFRMVLGRYFGVDLPYLEDRAYTSRSPRYVYDLTEVTHRLPR
ncbi:MAG TPA: sulfatase-like hydrolase/transferase [Candidatus Limnocylindrales bacterium]|nr:sulfatase-like hydrolase/transferase [Candidatus Limnocylindrales bacterium]